MANRQQHHYIRKLREIRDNIGIVVDQIKDEDYEIALSMLQEIYVEADLAIDHPCGCNDKH